MFFDGGESCLCSLILSQQKQPKLHQKSRLSTFDTWVCSGGGGGLHE